MVGVEEIIQIPDNPFVHFTSDEVGKYLPGMMLAFA
jgi:hypothetical protein